MEQTSARVNFSRDSNQLKGMGFMINWFIDWRRRSLLQHVHVVLSIICITKINKLVMKEMVAAWSM